MRFEKYNKNPIQQSRYITLIEKRMQRLYMEDLRGGVHEVLEEGKDGEKLLWNEPSCS